jgi:6-pyruvoyltetrahydropterin/6-carboxytetrahydropterin synthase
MISPSLADSLSWEPQIPLSTNRPLYDRTPSGADTIPRVINLSRTVRLVVGAGQPDEKSPNTFAGSPSMAGVGAYYEVEVRCAGEPEEVSGYLINIKRIDTAVREHMAPLIAESLGRGAGADIAHVLREGIKRLQRTLDAPISAVTWRLTPTYSIQMSAHAMETVTIRQQFEFAAAHRLAVDGWPDAENRKVFGKCANPAGHGHNYKLEAAVDAPVTDTGAPAISLRELERIVDGTVIERFDHKHLNRDTEEFAHVNPSVENIARVCHNLLEPEFERAGVSLRHVTVWETEKTSATYPAS